jgi:hypothetical protein
LLSDSLAGLLQLPLNVMFVVGGHMGLEARRPLLDFMVSEMNHAIGEGMSLVVLDSFFFSCLLP